MAKSIGMVSPHFSDQLSRPKLISSSDYCLGHFLRGVVQCVARYQPPEAALSASIPQPGEPNDAEIDKSAEADFLNCLKHSPEVRVSILLNKIRKV